MAVIPRWLVPQSLRESFGYDVVADSGNRRRSPLQALRSEDAELDAQKRKHLQAIQRDALRNFSVARWAMGKHLDFVTSFSFASQTRTSFDFALQARMEKWMNEKELCDITGRHTFPRMLRMTEARAAGDGDHLLLMLDDCRLQQIESDRIRTYREKAGANHRRVIHGCIQNEFGRNLAYQIWRRGERGTGYHFQQEVDARHCLFHAYFPGERADQTRGVGLLTSGLADFIDAYEWTGLAKAVEKVRAAFGVIFKGDNPDGHGKYTPLGNGKYDVSLGRGPFQLEMEPGDSVEFLTNDTPGGNTVAFFNACIGFALKSLDIPLCFFDETLTNFFGQRAQFILYIKSCMQKRDNLRANVLNPLTKWLVRRWVAEGSLQLPPNGSIESLPFRWHPAGTPYWNPIQEVTAQLMAIRGGLNDYESLFLETTGLDWYAMIDRLAEQQAYIKSKGVVLDESLAPVMAAMLIQQEQQADSPLNGIPSAPDGAQPDASPKRGTAV